MYVCGITPYDATHIGHAATYVGFDLLHRAWLDAGHQVRYVQNVTDVDDPLLARAAATGDDWQALAARETERFAGDMTALAVLPPALYLGVMESIDLVMADCLKLLADGVAYQVPVEDGDGADLYFSVYADPRFGQVSGLDEAAMMTLFAERGGDPERPGKRHPLDALLWRARRHGEPSWPGGALGPGRPGWHIECTAIALEHLGMGFDVQGGGSDLRFPHHEMGAAHGHLLTGDWPFAKVYAHAGMVGLHGRKMSKSLGNLVFVSALRADGVDPMAIRLTLLDHHYRNDWEWTGDTLAAAEKRLARWRQALSMQPGPAAGATLAGIREALADDLDAPRALAVVDRWAEQQLDIGGDDDGAPGIVSRAVDALLGIRL
jgi:L-cysteine:1D-myo-inositol 2-amino-2-deoxy-alpha-D-glucopyranoside ligase